MDHYILKGHEPIPCSMMEWAEWFGAKDDRRRVALDEKYGIKVSTVFLGLNHRWDDGPPLLFETMIFGGRHDQYQDRYSTWYEAVEGHKKAFALAFPTGFLGFCELFFGACYRLCVYELKTTWRKIISAWSSVQKK